MTSTGSAEPVRVLLSDLVAAGARRLSAGGVASPEFDAQELVALALGLDRGDLMRCLVTRDHVDLTPEQQRRLDELIARRADREPLQHLTGRASFRHVELLVGPGVFVPRPETELLAGWAIEQARALPEPVVVDLCTGSGAIAKAIADEVPHARVYAVELGDAAHQWAERNLAGTGVDLRHGDMAEAFDELAGQVDVVVSNPPYVPLDAWESVAPEARDHDPDLALFSGEDGLTALGVVARRAGTLLKPGGVVGTEHADVQGESVPALFAAAGCWREIRDHRDLAGRARFTTARLAR